MIVSDDFLKEVASEKKHTFISTGMSTEDEVEEAPYETGTKVSYSTYTKDPADGPEQHYI